MSVFEGEIKYVRTLNGKLKRVFSVGVMYVAFERIQALNVTSRTLGMYYCFTDNCIMLYFEPPNL